MATEAYCGPHIRGTHRVLHRGGVWGCWAGKGWEGLRVLQSGKTESLCYMCVLLNILCPGLMAIRSWQLLLGVKVWSLGRLQAGPMLSQASTA